MTDREKRLANRSTIELARCRTGRISQMSGKWIGLACAGAIIAAQTIACGRVHAEDKLLNEAVNFTGTLTYLSTNVPGLILVAVRNGETAFAGFGHITDKGSKTPDADTMFRIGSISKVFCGEVLASMVLDSKLHFADRLQDRLGYDVKLPEREGHPIRIIDLVTQILSS